MLSALRPKLTPPAPTFQGQGTRPGVKTALMTMALLGSMAPTISAAQSVATPAPVTVQELSAKTKTVPFKATLFKLPNKPEFAHAWFGKISLGGREQVMLLVRTESDDAHARLYQRLDALGAGAVIEGKGTVIDDLGLFKADGIHGFLDLKDWKPIP